jgi:hypothetical protein
MRVPRTGRRWLWPILWICLGLALVVRTGGRDRGVITDHLEFGRRLVAGEDLYAPYLDAPRPLHPVYPPSFGLMTWGFTLVPERAARYAWGVVQVLALWAIGACLARWLARLWPDLVPRRHLLLALTAVLASRFLLRDSHGGGGNLINLALALGGLELAERGRALGGGLLLAASFATKPVTVLLLPLVWLIGQRRAALWSVFATLGLALVAIVVHGRGVDAFASWLRGSLAYGAMDDVFATPAQGFPPFAWMNQCLRCALARWLGDVPPELAAEVPGFVAGLGLAPTAVAWLSRALAMALLVATGLSAWRARRSPAGRWHAIAATFALSLLLSPISWKAHHTALVPALFVLVIAARERGAIRALMVGYFLLCTAGGGDLVGTAAKVWMESCYVVTLGTLCLWGVTVAITARAAR